MRDAGDEVERLARAAARGVHEVSLGLDGRVPPHARLTAGVRRRRRHRRVAVAITSVAVAGVAFSALPGDVAPLVPIIGQELDPTPSPAPSRDTEEGRPCEVGARDDHDHEVEVEVEGWEQLTPPPAPRARAASVWVEDRLLLIGGESRPGFTHDDTFAYDPDEDEWSCAPPAPFSSSLGATAIGNGEVYLVAQGRAAAFDVTMRTWRRLPDPPIRGTPMIAAWTGDRLLVWGSRTRGPASRAGAVYDPVADDWEPIADAPLGINVGEAVWTGEAMIAVGAEQTAANVSSSATAQAVAYDPARDEWRPLPEPGLSPQYVTVTWVGEHVIAVDEEHAATAYDLDANAWVRLDEIPGRGTGGWAATALGDGRVVVFDGVDMALLESGASTWTVIETPASAGATASDARVITGRPVSTNGAVIFVGATQEGDADRAWRYTPPD